MNGRSRHVCGKVFQEIFHCPSKLNLLLLSPTLSLSLSPYFITLISITSHQGFQLRSWNVLIVHKTTSPETSSSLINLLTAFPLSYIIRRTKEAQSWPALGQESNLYTTAVSLFWEVCSLFLSFIRKELDRKRKKTSEEIRFFQEILTVPVEEKFDERAELEIWHL